MSLPSLLFHNLKSKSRTCHASRISTFIKTSLNKPNPVINLSDSQAQHTISTLTRQYSTYPEINLAHVFDGFKLPLLPFEITLRLLACIYLNYNKQTPSKITVWRENIESFSLERISEELGDDPTPSSSQSVYQSVRHSF